MNKLAECDLHSERQFLEPRSIQQSSSPSCLISIYDGELILLSTKPSTPTGRIETWLTSPNSYDLAPTSIARPLAPVSNRKRAEAKSKGKTPPPATRSTKGTKRKRGRGGEDDTPRAFKRLMAFTKGQKTRSGLDDGLDELKEPKKEATDETEEEAATPSIRPGESLSDFAARVDAAIPVTGLINKTSKGGKDPVGLKAYRTRKEKKMHKLYDQWRAEEKKIQERREEELELAAERELESGTLWSGADGPKDWDPVSKGGKGKKKKKRGGKGRNREEDPWEELRRKRGEGKVRLRDVAQAPPSLQKVSEKLPTQT